MLIEATLMLEFEAILFKFEFEFEAMFSLEAHPIRAREL
jgi:hypothetical protein